MVNLTITSNNIQVKKKFVSIKKGLKDFRKPLKDTSKDLMKLYSKDTFDTRGGAIGDKWPRLSPATLLLRKERRGYYRRTPKRRGMPLIWTGRLQKGFKSSTTRFRLTIKNTVDYFKYHQASKGRPPQRRMLGITKNVIAIVVKNFNSFLAQKLK